MTSWKAIKTLIIGAIFVVPVSAAQAVVIDFTSNAWSGANGTSNHTVGGVTLSSGDDKMTFNEGVGEIAGCNAAGSGSTSLACNGDGIGITNDEITEGGNQTLTVAFDEDLIGPVNIKAIHLLDLFADERGGETAVISWGSETINPKASGSHNPGGYWEVNFPYDNNGNLLIMAGIGSFTLTGFGDHFSDYALARIEFSAVPIPAAFWMFGTALIGFVAMSRRTKV